VFLLDLVLSLTSEFILYPIGRGGAHVIFPKSEVEPLGDTLKPKELKWYRFTRVISGKRYLIRENIPMLGLIALVLLAIATDFIFLS